MNLTLTHMEDFDIAPEEFLSALPHNKAHKEAGAAVNILKDGWFRGGYDVTGLGMAELAQALITTAQAATQAAQAASQGQSNSATESSVD